MPLAKGHPALLRCTNPSTRDSPQLYVPSWLSKHQQVSSGSWESDGIAWIKYLACPAILESYHFKNSSNSLKYTPDSQVGKELTLVSLQWHNCSLQLCLQDSPHLDKPQQRQHISQVTGDTHVQQEQEILREPFDPIAPLTGDEAGTDCPSSGSHPAEETWSDGKTEMEITSLPSALRGRATAVQGSNHRGWRQGKGEQKRLLKLLQNRAQRDELRPTPAVLQQGSTYCFHEKSP